jgi:hypothetical protein
MSAIDAPLKYELMYTGRTDQLVNNGKDYDGFQPLEGTYEEVSKKAVELNEAQLAAGRRAGKKKPQITRLFFPELKAEPVDDDTAIERGVE